MTTSIEWLLSFVIPEVMSSPEEQIATLKHTLSKLSTPPGPEAMRAVSSDMLKYMRYLDSPEKAHLKEYILGELTETELEGLLSLVESASEQLKKQESEKSATRSKIMRAGAGISGGAHSGVGGLSPMPKAWAEEITKSISGSNKLLEAWKDKK